MQNGLIFKFRKPGSELRKVPEKLTFIIYISVSKFLYFCRKYALPCKFCNDAV